MAKEPLDYATPQPSKPGRNRWWKVILRIMAGAAGGVVSCLLGLWLVGLTGSAVIGFLPFLVLFGVAIWIAVSLRRYGYMTGLILAPFLTAAALIALLIILCGKGGGL